MTVDLPATLVIVLLAVNLLSFGAASWRCRPGGSCLPQPRTPPVSIIRPLAGMENYLEEMLRSNFELDYPDYEILFCVQRTDDAVIPLVRRLIAEYPSRDAKLLIGDDPFSANPKLNNCLKGWENSRHELVIMADSNVLMPLDYIQVLLKHLSPDISVTFSPPIGARPESFWSDVECAFLNSFQARILYAGDVLRLKPIQGKSMLLRRSWLEACGGIRGLSAELAEDIALRKMILRSRSQTRIVDAPFEQVLGKRTIGEVIQRQRRWAVLRRLASPRLYTLELMLGGATPMACAAFAAITSQQNPLSAAGSVGAIIYACESAFAWRLGWLHSWRSPLAFIVRDLLLPVIWVCGIFDRGYSWRGFKIRTGGSELQWLGRQQ